MSNTSGRRLLRTLRDSGLNLLQRSGPSAPSAPSAPEPPRAPSAAPAPAGPQQPGQRRQDGRYPGAWQRLAGVVLGEPVPADPFEFSPPTTKQAMKRARLTNARAMLAAAIERGETLERAVRDAVGELCAHKNWDAAWALSTGVGRLPGGAVAAAVGHAIILHERKQFARIWPLVSNIDEADRITHLPIETADGAYAALGCDAAQQLAGFAAAAPTFDTATLIDLAGRFLVFESVELAGALAAELRTRSVAELDEARASAARLIDTWLQPAPHPVPEGAVPLAILDYQSPDHGLASGNIGDHIQTLALLGNVAALRDVTFTGEAGLGELVTELQQRVRPELQRPVTGAVHLLDVSREFTTADDIPPGTWMIAFGWHMHSLYDLRYDFPYHENLLPIFVSFHVNRTDLLTDEALAYLRRYGPVGCRDWNTVDLLLSLGVDAFFTGCLTTTVNATFPHRDDAYRGDGVVGVIDRLRRAAGADAHRARVFEHDALGHKQLPLVDGVRAAIELLTEYQSTFERAISSRLHAYLPLVSLGVPVEFRPFRPGDVRFAGLSGLDAHSPRLHEIQRGLADLISSVLTKVLSGADPKEVYALWAELTADRVAQARARWAGPVDDPATSIDVASATARTRAGTKRFGPHDGVDPATVTDVVVSYDANLARPAAVTLESMLANASGPLRLWLLARGLDDGYLEWLAGAFPQLPITVLPCDHVSYGGRARFPARITVSTMDRLLLPELLDEVDRVVYLDVDTLVLGDICRLGRLDLGGHPVAARDATVSAVSELRGVATLLSAEHSTELLRRMSRKHAFAGKAINAGVLVLDLARMRADDFTRTYLGWVERYSLHDQDVMLAYAGADRVHLPPEWNALPVLEDVRDPQLIHWAAMGKPWGDQLAFAQDQWQVYADRLRSRAGDPPAGNVAR